LKKDEIANDLAAIIFDLEAFCSNETL